MAWINSFIGRETVSAVKIDISMETRAVRIPPKLITNPVFFCVLCKVSYLLSKTDFSLSIRLLINLLIASISFLPTWLLIISTKSSIFMLPSFTCCLDPITFVFSHSNHFWYFSFKSSKFFVAYSFFLVSSTK